MACARCAQLVVLMLLRKVLLAFSLRCVGILALFSFLLLPLPSVDPCSLPLLLFLPCVGFCVRLLLLPCFSMDLQDVLMICAQCAQIMSTSMLKQLLSIPCVNLCCYVLV